jgi:HPt (histidine-containing phosphotransfer) domain-containing protein
VVSCFRAVLNETQTSFAALVREPLPDPERIKRIMHRIKGAASNLSLPRVTAEAKAAEAAAPTMSAEDYAAALGRIGE